MKHIIIPLLVLFLIAAPVFADSSSVFDYTDDILEDGSLIYYFQDLSLQLPAEWRGKVIAIQNDSGVSFYQRASHDKYLEEGINNGGFLFMLGASVNDSFSELPSYKYLGFSEASVMNYYLMLPTDYPAYNDPEIRAEYDMMYSQTDYVAEHAQFYPVQKDTAGTTGSDTEWTPSQARYSFEHIILPRYFYEVPENLLSAIQANGLYTLWKTIAEENGIDPTYPVEDYTEQWYSLDDGTLILQADLPEPDANTLCYRLYFLYNPETGKTGYYTSESDEFMPDSAFLCTWLPDRTHQILGTIPVGNNNKKSIAHEEALLKEVKAIIDLAFSADSDPEP